MEKIKIDKGFFLNGFNFARRANIIFSEVVSNKKFFELNTFNVKKINHNKNEVIYINKKFRVYENDIIFTNLVFIKLLFKKLNKIKNLKNLKLISHYSDESVDEALFNLKPKAISFWYGINVNYKNENLIPIPLGLSGDYSNKNIKEDELIDNESSDFSRRNITLYLNFQKNTNLKKRQLIYDQFKKYEWVKVDEPNLKIDDYIDTVSNSKFVLCPAGNGIDTHRIWESLYLGAVPIVETHHTLKTLKDIPHISVSSFDLINLSYLEKYKIPKSFNVNKLSTDYWMNEINRKKIDSNEYFDINISRFEIFWYSNIYKIKKINTRYMKKIKFRIRQVNNLLRLNEK